MSITKCLAGAKEQGLFLAPCCGALDCKSAFRPSGSLTLAALRFAVYRIFNRSNAKPHIFNNIQPCLKRLICVSPYTRSR